jgi:uncharacterized protein (TIGR02118 family)
MPHKHIFLLYRPAEKAPEPIHERLLGGVADAVIGAGARKVTVNVADTGLRGLRSTREDGAPLTAMVSVWGLSDEALPQLRRTLDPSERWSAGYRVSEATPLGYDHRGPHGSRSPGVVQVTCLRRRPGMERDAFLRHWHERHTPLALRVHPLWRYSRNVVETAVTSDAPPHEGLVELHFRYAEDLKDPVRMYGGDPDNAAVIADDVKQFIDMQAIQVTPMSEYVFGG